LILEICFGGEFKAAYPALVVLVAGQFVNAASGSTGFFMNMTGKQRIFSWVIAVAAVLNVMLGLLLIPRWGAVGGAWAATISLAFWNVITLGYIKGIHGRSFGYLPVPKLGRGGA
jgi:O-antigen/teichoic acid export membrane protein